MRDDEIRTIVGRFETVLRQIRDELRQANEGNEKDRRAAHRHAEKIEETLAQQ